jgi:hypothetical protein
VILLFSILFGYSQNSHAAEYKPVLYLRTCFESLSNQGTITGTTTNFGGMSLIYFYPLTAKLFAGFGYASSFDLTAQTLPITGYSFHGKWYFRGQGTTISYKEDWGSSESRPTSAYYVGGAYVYNTYYLGDDPASTAPKDNLSGQYSNINTYVGMDRAINKKFSWNAEGGMSLLTMAASDARVKIQSNFVYIGLSYIF